MIVVLFCSSELTYRTKNMAVTVHCKWQW